MSLFLASKFLPTGSRAAGAQGDLYVTGSTLTVNYDRVACHTLVATTGTALDPFLIPREVVHRVARASSKLNEPIVLAFGDSPETSELLVGDYTFPVLGGKYQLASVGNYIVPQKLTNERHLMTLPAKTLLEALASVKASVIASNQNLPILECVHFSTFNGEPVLVSTDRFRLTVRPIRGGVIAKDSNPFSVNFRDLENALKVLGADGEVALVVDDVMLGIRSGDTLITLEKKDEDYPAWGKLMPTVGVEGVQIKVSDVFRDLDILNAPKDTQSCAVRVEQGIWQIGLGEQGVGPVHPIDRDNGYEMAVTLDPHRLKDIAAVFGKKSIVNVGRTREGRLAPVIFREEATGTHHLLMPTNVPSETPFSSFFGG